LKKTETIQSFIAFSLLVFFTISITPKIYFHDVIANHKDSFASCNHPQKTKACLHQKAFHCQVNDLVVATPYLVFEVPASSLVQRIFIDFNSAYFSSFIQYCFIHKESRGPPWA